MSKIVRLFLALVVLFVSLMVAGCDHRKHHEVVVHQNGPMMAEVVEPRHSPNINISVNVGVGHRDEPSRYPAVSCSTASCREESVRPVVVVPAPARYEEEMVRVRPQVEERRYYVQPRVEERRVYYVQPQRSPVCERPVYPSVAGRWYSSREVPPRPPVCRPQPVYSSREGCR